MNEQALATMRAQLDRQIAQADAEMAAGGDADRQEPTFTILTAEEVCKLGPTPWAVKNVLPRNGVVSIYGPSGSGKSFLEMDLAVALCTRATWFGHRVQAAGKVVFICLEGQGGVARRICAWERANELPFPNDILFVFDSFHINDLAVDVPALAERINAIGGVSTTILETVNRSAAGADENSSSDMGRVIDGLQLLQQLTDTLVIATHHAGKDASRGLRGHSSLLAALDAVIEVSRDGDRREWKLTKAKDGEDGIAHAFRLKVVELGEDEDGDPITSCVIEPTVALDDIPSNRPKAPRGGNQRIVYDALGPLLRESGAYGRGGAPAHRPCVLIEEAIARTADRLTVEPKRKPERARQAITAMAASGVLGTGDGWLWMN